YYGEGDEPIADYLDGVLSASYDHLTFKMRTDNYRSLNVWSSDGRKANIAIIVGGQAANPVFKYFADVGKISPITGNGYKIQYFTYKIYGETMHIFAVAGWEAEDTWDAARELISKYAGRDDHKCRRKNYGDTVCIDKYTKGMCDVRKKLYLEAVAYWSCTYCENGSCYPCEPKALDERRCNGNKVERKYRDKYCNYYWQVEKVCSSNQYCRNGKCINKTCADYGLEACSSIGSKKCKKNAVYECKYYKGAKCWVKKEDCGSLKECKNGECVCQNACSPGESRCGGNGGKYIIECGEMDGCYVWKDQKEYCEYGCVDGFIVNGKRVARCKPKIVEYSSPIIETAGDEIIAMVFLKNLGGSMWEEWLVELSPRDDDSASDGLPNNGNHCDESYQENVHEKFKLAKNEHKAITLISRVKEGTYDVYLVSVDKCCTKGPCNAVEPYGWGKKVATLHVPVCKDTEASFPYLYSENIHVKGEIFINNKKEAEDYCIDSYTLREYYCTQASGQKYSYEDIQCNGICQNGKCIECTNECFPGAPTQCNILSGTLSRCEMGADGCYHWVEFQTCVNGCRVLPSGEGVCNECRRESTGNKRCNGKWVEEEYIDYDCSTKWQKVEECQYKCQNGKCVSYDGKITLGSSFGDVPKSVIPSTTIWIWYNITLYNYGSPSKKFYFKIELVDADGIVLKTYQREINALFGESTYSQINVGFTIPDVEGSYFLKAKLYDDEVVYDTVEKEIFASFGCDEEGICRCRTDKGCRDNQKCIQGICQPYNGIFRNVEWSKPCAQPGETVSMRIKAESTANGNVKVYVFHTTLADANLLGLKYKEYTRNLAATIEGNLDKGYLELSFTPQQIGKYYFIVRGFGETAFSNILYVGYAPWNIQKVLRDGKLVIVVPDDFDAWGKLDKLKEVLVSAYGSRLIRFSSTPPEGMKCIYEATDQTYDPTLYYPCGEVKYIKRNDYLWSEKGIDVIEESRFSFDIIKKMGANLLILSRDVSKEPASLFNAEEGKLIQTLEADNVKAIILNMKNSDDASALERLITAISLSGDWRYSQMSEFTPGEDLLLAAGFVPVIGDIADVLYVVLYDCKTPLEYLPHLLAGKMSWEIYLANMQNCAFGAALVALPFATIGGFKLLKRSAKIAAEAWEKGQGELYTLSMKYAKTLDEVAEAAEDAGVYLRFRGILDNYGHGLENLVDDDVRAALIAMKEIASDEALWRIYSKIQPNDDIYFLLKFSEKIKLEESLRDNFRVLVKNKEFLDNLEEYVKVGFYVPKNWDSFSQEEAIHYLQSIMLSRASKQLDVLKNWPKILAREDDDFARAFYMMLSPTSGMHAQQGAYIVISLGEQEVIKNPARFYYVVLHEPSHWLD
ncbi:MAG: hypothetical protein DRO04_01145, partial [Candidatus Iainarchaeum archaeon]